MVDCVVESSSNLPSTIVDLGSLSIEIDNTGIARLSITILTKNTATIAGACNISLGGGRTLNGSIVEDNPRELVGTDYYEHSLTVLGMVD